jgi:glycosyltransferase involved in cell wall biosynthesis
MSITIAFIGPLPPPIGGVSIINQSFQQLDYSNLAIVAFNTSNNRTHENLYRRFPWRNILNEFKKIRKLSDFLKVQQPKVVNVFVTSGYSIIRDCIYLIVIKWFHIPVIIHFHSKKQGEFALKAKRLKLLGMYFNRFTDKIILLSQDHFTFFTDYFPKDKCFIIENFVNYNNYACEIEDKANEFLFVGRLTKEKGFFDLLEAIKLLKLENIQLKIHVLGIASTKGDENNIKGIISKSKIDEYLIFHGLKLGKDKFEIFRKSRFLVLPSHFENSPVVIKEAIAAKMGIIASDIKANKLILSEVKNHFLHQVGKPESIADAIKTVLNMPDKGISLCFASSTIHKYDSSIARDKLISLINELI